MQWTATPERDAAAADLEKRLWAAADELRNSGLTAAGVLYLPAEARYDALLEHPEGGKDGRSLGQAVDEAMRAIEQDNFQLSGVLPKTYQGFNARLLKKLLKSFFLIAVDLESDPFGKIYEYFLAEFAMTDGQGGGEFYTPTSLVRLKVEVIEPFAGRDLDPACGSGGMFVQSARFVVEHRKPGRCRSTAWKQLSMRDCQNALTLFICDVQLGYAQR